VIKLVGFQRKGIGTLKRHMYKIASMRRNGK
jgi:hypothetical protein